MSNIKLMHDKNTYFPKKHEILPKWRIFPLFFDNTHAWLLRMGGSEITVLKLFPAVSGLEHSLTPTPPSTFMGQAAIWLLCWETSHHLQSGAECLLCVSYLLYLILRVPILKELSIESRQ